MCPAPPNHHHATHQPAPHAASAPKPKVRQPRGEQGGQHRGKLQGWGAQGGALGKRGAHWGAAPRTRWGPQGRGRPQQRPGLHRGHGDAHHAPRTPPHSTGQAGSCTPDLQSAKLASWCGGHHWEVGQHGSTWGARALGVHSTGRTRGQHHARGAPRGHAPGGTRESHHALRPQVRQLRGAISIPPRHHQPPHTSGRPPHTYHLPARHHQLHHQRGHHLASPSAPTSQPAPPGRQHAPGPRMTWTLQSCCPAMHPSRGGSCSSTCRRRS